MNNNSNTNKSDQGVNLVDIFAYFVSKWQWFLISVLVCGGIAWYMYAKSPLVYYRSATVIIKDPSNKTSTAGLDRYDNFINKVNVANEILQFRSKRLMREVVKRIHADVNYRIEDGLRYNELYTLSPVVVSFVDDMPGMYLSLTVEPVDKSTVKVAGMSEENPDAVSIFALNDTVEVRKGMRMVVSPSNFYTDEWTGKKIIVQKLPLEAVVAYYRGMFSVKQETEESSILTMSMQDFSPLRAEDMLNTLITVYNEEAIRDKNQVAINTADFINDRLIIIENELGGVEYCNMVMQNDEISS